MALGLVVALAARPPDVLVSADARLIAMRSGSTVFLVAQPKASRFTLEQWQTVWGSTPLTPAQCTAQSCRIGAVWFTTAPVCAPAQLIVAPIELPGCAAPYRPAHGLSAGRHCRLDNAKGRGFAYGPGDAGHSPLGAALSSTIDCKNTKLFLIYVYESDSA
jgi:hypothetical protein